MGLSDAIGIGGSILGGLFGGGNKSTTSSIDRTTNSQSNASNLQTGWQQQIEEPWFGQARQGIMGQLMGQMKKANQPVFGQAQQAQYLQQLNGLAQSSIDSLKSNLARTGGLDSGRFGAGLTDIGLGRMGQASNFYAQLPFQEKQAQAALMNPLLQIGAGWTGAAPKSVYTMGQGVQNQSSTEHTTGTETQNTKGAPMWQQALGGFGAGLGAAAGGMFGNMFGGNGFSNGQSYDTAMAPMPSSYNPFSIYSGWK